MTSYAWLIFLHASESPGARELALEWGHTFIGAFRPAYIRVVLPLFDQPEMLKLADMLLDKLSKTQLKIKDMQDPAAIVEQLVCLSKSYVTRAY